MSIDIEIGSGLSDGDAAHLAAKTEVITTAMQQVQESHPAYSWVWTDEIRCRGCKASLEIPRLASTKANADRAFEAHRSAQMDAWLALDGLAGGGNRP